MTHISKTQVRTNYYGTILSENVIKFLSLCKLFSTANLT